MRNRMRLLITMLLLVLPAASAIAEGQAVERSSSLDRIFLGLAAVLAVGISCVTSSYALSRIGTAAMGAMSEKPELGGRAIVFLGMAEGIAIYGLIVAIMLINRI